MALINRTTKFKKDPATTYQGDLFTFIAGKRRRQRTAGEFGTGLNTLLPGIPPPVPPPPAVFLLSENSEFLLTQNNDNIIL